MRRSLCFVAVAGAALAALFLPVRQSLAWGPEANRVIALIADALAPSFSGTKNFVNALNFADSRATPGMFGSGYLELLAREITTSARISPRFCGTSTASRLG